MNNILILKVNKIEFYEKLYITLYVRKSTDCAVLVQKKGSIKCGIFEQNSPF